MVENPERQFTIQEKIYNFDLIFKTTYGLFAYKEIDDGTRLLINSIKIEDGTACLDLGCGYGVIGIVMAKLNPNGRVYCVDRDFVAVEYAKKNCELNDIRNCEVFLSDGFSNIRDLRFDIIASNPPTHISHDMLKLIFSDAKKYLKPHGKLYVVTASKLKRFIKTQFEEIFHNYTHIQNDNLYTVSLVEKL